MIPNFKSNNVLSSQKKLTIHKHENPIRGVVSVPSSKSVTNRALLAGAFAHGRSNLSNILISEDTHWGIEACKQLTPHVHLDANNLTIKGVGENKIISSKSIHVGSAGTLARFLPAMLTVAPGGPHTLTASEQMMNRPMEGLLNGLIQAGGAVKGTSRSSSGAVGYPIRINKSNGLAEQKIYVSGDKSSQFVSALLLAAPLGLKALEVVILGPIVQRDYIDITIDIMKKFGAEIFHDPVQDNYKIEPTGYTSTSLSIEGDYSTASYFAALAAVTEGTIELLNLNIKSHQPDKGFLNILAKMGCKIKHESNKTLVVGPPRGRLRGGFSVDMNPMSDTSLTLAAVAAFADAPINITGIEHIRLHESDRITAICEGLSKMGVKCEPYKSGMKIYPSVSTMVPGIVNTYDDHRIAMALSIVAVAGNGATILDPSCVKKTCPIFFEILSHLGVQFNSVME